MRITIVLFLSALSLAAGSAVWAGPAAAARLSGPAEWTVMVYLNARNDLEYSGLDDLNEMELAGSTGKVNVVAELGRLGTYDQGDGGWHGVRRYLVKREAFPAVINSPVLETLQADMGDWRHLAEFGRWAKTNFPARKYLLVVWNHGTGWEKAAVPGGPFKGISYDESSGNHISTPELAAALGELGRVDVLAFDACLMQMAEVVYEVKDYAAYVVGSEETEPGSGYPYDKFLKELLRDPAMGPERLSAALVESFYAYYAGHAGLGAMQSAVRTAALPRFLELANGWAERAMASGDKAAVLGALRAAQGFGAAGSRDLRDFLRLTAERTGDPELAAKSSALAGFISGELVLLHKAAGGTHPGSNGLAVFLPSSRYNPDYDALRWARDSRWDEFIGWYLKPPSGYIGPW